MGGFITGLRMQAARVVGGTPMRELERAATVDELTGIANRRVGLGALDSSLAAADQPTSVAMFDLDHFKAVNDTWGHQVGDETLVAAASTIDDVATSFGGTAARLGGEEFAMVLPGTGAAMARDAVQRVLAGIRAIEVPTPDGGVLRPTSSAGVVTHAAPSSTAAPAGADLLATADEALYAAKSSGRDRMVAARIQ